MLVTERPGRLRFVGRDGKLSEALTGVPLVFAQGQGGLLDVALDPEFASWAAQLVQQTKNISFSVTVASERGIHLRTAVTAAAGACAARIER